MGDLLTSDDAGSEAVTLLQGTLFCKDPGTYILEGPQLVVGPTPLKPHPTPHFSHPTPRGVYPTQLFDSEVGWGVGWGNLRFLEPH